MYWPAAGGGAPVDGREDGGEREEPGPEIGDRQPGFHRRSSRLAGDRHDPRCSLRHQIKPTLRRRGPGLPIAGDRGVDEARVLLRERRVVEPQARHHAGPVVFDEDVGRACEPPERVARGGLLQVEDDTELAAVDSVERRALGAGRSGHRARGVAVWRLDLDDARPHVAEYHRAVRPGHDLSHVEHNYAVE